MKVIAAYLLACLGGNANPSAADIKSILSSVAIDVDEDRLKLFMSQVEGKDITEVIATGRQKLASVPSGGGACVAAAGGAATGGAPPAEDKEEKVEEKDETWASVCLIRASDYFIFVRSLVYWRRILQTFYQLIQSVVRSLILAD